MWTTLELYKLILYLLALTLGATLTSHGSGSPFLSSLLLATFLLAGRSRSIPLDTHWALVACASLGATVPVLSWDADGTHVGLAGLLVPALAFAVPGLLAPRALIVAEVLQQRRRYVDRAAAFALLWAAWGMFVASLPLGLGRAVDWSSRGSLSIEGHHPLDPLRILFGPSGVSFAVALLACPLQSILRHLEDLAFASSLIDTPSTSTSSSSSSEHCLSREESETALPIARLSLTPPSTASPGKLHFGIPFLYLFLLAYSAFHFPATSYDLTHSQPLQLGCVVPPPMLDRSTTEAREAMLHASRVRASYGDQLLVWPESALLLTSDTQEHQLWHAAANITHTHGVVLLLTYTYSTPSGRLHRSALFTPTSYADKPVKPQLIYDKLHPLPFLEQGVIPGVRGANTTLVTFTLGPAQQRLTLRLGISICHDVAFTPTFTPSMPQVILVPARSAPFEAAAHSLAALRDRTLESGAQAGFRCDGARGGITAAVDAKGRVIGTQSGTGGGSVKVGLKIRESGEKGVVHLEASSWQPHIYTWLLNRTSHPNFSAIILLTLLSVLIQLVALHAPSAHALHAAARARMGRAVLVDWGANVWRRVGTLGEGISEREREGLGAERVSYGAVARREEGADA